MSRRGGTQRIREETVAHLQRKPHLNQGEKSLLAAHKTIEQLRVVGAARCARALELEVFRQMSSQLIAQNLDRSEDTIIKDLQFARATLRRNLQGDQADSEE